MRCQRLGIGIGLSTQDIIDAIRQQRRIRDPEISSSRRQGGSMTISTSGGSRLEVLADGSHDRRIDPGRGVLARARANRFPPSAVTLTAHGAETSAGAVPGGRFPAAVRPGRRLLGRIDSSGDRAQPDSAVEADNDDDDDERLF